MMVQDEAARLDALHQLSLLDTPPSESFDRITRMASQLFNLPISAVSLTDRGLQGFKSRVGVEHTTIPQPTSHAKRRPHHKGATTLGVRTLRESPRVEPIPSMPWYFLCFSVMQFIPARDRRARDR